MNLIINIKLLKNNEILLFKNSKENDYAYFLCLSNFFILRIFNFIEKYWNYQASIFLYRKKFYRACKYLTILI